jgi:hypothetical protein
MSNDDEAMTRNRRKLRVLVITMGSTRQEQIEQQFALPRMAQHFERPEFSPGVPSRSLRTRFEFLRIANDCGLLPKAEWGGILAAKDNPIYDCEKLFDCLQDVPVTQGRQGSACDVELHYSVELWRKAKTINRGRAVLGCSFAHLIAIKRLVAENFDFILEDNVRAPPESCAKRIWEAMEASLEYGMQQPDNAEESSSCHLRLYGWLGSIPNLEWMLEIHSQKRVYIREAVSDADKSPQMSVFPFPIAENLEADIEEWQENENGKHQNDADEEEADALKAKVGNKTPGGVAIWGAYCYWMSARGYEYLMNDLRNDVGKMLWKGKRQRYYAVKPIDKILPRLTKAAFGHQSVHIATHPAFFRAPMLTSKIHTQFDPEFCKSTEYQLRRGGLDWSDLWLSDAERKIVDHRKAKGEWLTLAQLELKSGEKQDEEKECPPH